MSVKHVMPVRQLTQMAVFAAIAIILVYFIHLPIFPAVSYLEYDPGDIPIILGTFMFGPAAGLALTFVVCVVQGVTVSAQNGIVGIAMHFLATGSYVIVAGLIYRKEKSVPFAVIAMFAGTLVMCGTMVLWNLLITPVYLGVPRSVVIGVMPYIASFNLIKAGGNSVIAFIVFKALGKFLIKGK